MDWKRTLNLKPYAEFRAQGLECRTVTRRCGNAIGIHASIQSSGFGAKYKIRPKTLKRREYVQRLWMWTGPHKRFVRLYELQLIFLSCMI